MSSIVKKSGKYSVTYELSEIKISEKFSEQYLSELLDEVTKLCYSNIKSDITIEGNAEINNIGELIINDVAIIRIYAIHPELSNIGLDVFDEIYTEIFDKYLIISTGVDDIITFDSQYLYHAKLSDNVEKDLSQITQYLGIITIHSKKISKLPDTLKYKTIIIDGQYLTESLDMKNMFVTNCNENTLFYKYNNHVTLICQNDIDYTGLIMNWRKNNDKSICISNMNTDTFTFPDFEYIRITHSKFDKIVFSSKTKLVICEYVSYKDISIGNDTEFSTFSCNIKEKFYKSEIISDVEKSFLE